MRGVGFDCVYLLGFFVFGVAQRRPALFESGHYLMRAQVLANRQRIALIKQNAHLRWRQSAPGRMVEYGLDLL